MFRAHRPPTLEAAEGIAAQGLGFLAADQARLSRFLMLTGLTPDQVRAQADSRAFLAAVLEHLAADESLLLVFAASASVPPGMVAQAVELLQQASRAAASS